MKILFVTQAVPDEHGSGSPRRAANLLRALTGLGPVTAVLPNAALELRTLAGVKALGAAGIVVREEPSLSQSIGYRAQAAKGKPWRPWLKMRRLPDQDGAAQMSYVAKYRAAIGTNFDLIFAYRMQSAVWLDSLFEGLLPPTAKRVVDFDDIESLAFAGTQAHLSSGLPLPRWQQACFRRWIATTERRLAREWDAVTLCSELDVQRLAGITGKTAWVVPNAVAFPPPQPPSDQPGLKLLFVGRLDYWPNEQGIAWFVAEVWPLIRFELGARVTLNIVGMAPSLAVRGLAASPGVTLHPDVPDVTLYYDAAHVVIAPVLAGSGTRVKIIEAASRSRAVLTTTIGCEGLDFVDGVHAEIADDPTEFAGRVVRLALDPDRRARLAQAAYAHAERSFAAPRVQAALRARLENLVTDAGSGSPKSSLA